jgi:HPt (histidine-containing phosphotransfer) domain-containing protein
MPEPIVVHIDAELEPLMPAFLGRQRLALDNLRSAFAAERFATVRELAHTMKGVGGGYGLDRLTELGGEIETAVKQEETAAIGPLLDGLADYLDRLEIVFDE